MRLTGKPRFTTKWRSFLGTFFAIGLGHIICDNIWWIVGWKHALPWYVMPVVVTLVSLGIALFVEKKLHGA